MSEGKWQGNISIESIKLDGTKGISHVVFEGGLANGYGEATIIPPNDKRITYQGQFKDGQFNGAGKLITPRGTYSGEFQDGKLTGDARYVSPDESIKYTGPLHNYKPHGIGKLASTKGSISGEFVNGKPMGAVIFEPANSIWAYKGELRNGMPDGLGTYTFKNGNKLTINTVSGVPDSTGIINYTNGDVYEGEIVSMLPEGRGRISNRLNNTWYEGEFRNGVPDGNGVYSDSTGLYEVNYTKGKQTTRIKLAGASGISNDVGTEQKSEDIMDRLDRVLEYFAKQRATQDAAVAQSKQSRDNRPTISCLLKHEWTSGLNKNCVYDCVGSEAVNTIGAANICPLLWERDFWR
ncbi:MAG TPA: hypothetical protein PLW81_04310 [Thiobacillaceae bacterium]|nr:hypothetical protein [Thiobacillaceae bacterium]